MLSSITPCPGPRPQSFEVLHCWGHQVLREEVPWRKVGEESPLHYSILLIEHDSTVPRQYATHVASFCATTCQHASETDIAVFT